MSVDKKWYILKKFLLHQQSNNNNNGNCYQLLSVDNQLLSIFAHILISSSIPMYFMIDLGVSNQENKVIIHASLWKQKQ